jgi:hypothetical protein
MGKMTPVLPQKPNKKSYGKSGKMSEFVDLGITTEFLKSIA